MPFTIKELEMEYTDKCFFTSDRRTIEYLIQENLDPLNEYAFLTQKGGSILLTSEEIETDKVEQLIYSGYSNVHFQNKTENIRKKLDDILSHSSVEVMEERFEYTDYFQKKGRSVIDVTEQKRRQARIKGKNQLDAITRCMYCNQKAYRTIRHDYVNGKSELDIYKDIIEAIQNYTGYKNEIILDLLSGVRTANISDFPKNIIPRAGECVIVDLLPREKGVFTDTTRTFFIDEPTEKQREIYRIILSALEEGRNKLKPGVPVKEVYRTIQRKFGKYGTMLHFPHHAGHGFGMGYYDAPYILKEEEELLEEGMVIALEPGIYLPGEFGIRVEDDFVITKNGAEKIGNIPLNIEEYICG